MCRVCVVCLSGMLKNRVSVIWVQRPMTVDELEAQLLGQQQQNMPAPQLQPGMHGYPPPPPNAAFPRPQPPPRHVQMAPGQEQLAYTGLHPPALGMNLPGPGLLPPSHDRSFPGVHAHTNAMFIALQDYFIQKNITALLRFEHMTSLIKESSSLGLESSPLSSASY